MTHEAPPVGSLVTMDGRVYKVAEVFRRPGNKLLVMAYVRNNNGWGFSRLQSLLPHWKPVTNANPQ